MSPIVRTRATRAGDRPSPESGGGSRPLARLVMVVMVVAPLVAFGQVVGGAAGGLRPGWWWWWWWLLGLRPCPEWDEFVGAAVRR